MKHYFSFLFLIIPFISSAQIVEEVIQVDTTTETVNVVYKPSVSNTYYTKKVAAFASNESQIAIEKSYNKFGQNGLYKVFYPNGRLKIKTVFANNKINGEWTYYDENGIIKIKGLYKNGVKHGYWAYKHLKTYGRYKKGLKNKKWKRFDLNGKKYLSHYKKGRLTGGEGFGNETPIILYKEPEKQTNNNSEMPGKTFPPLSSEYGQAITFLTSNPVFRKALKEHFAKGDLKVVRKLKKHFVRGQFQFMVEPTIYFLDDSLFYADLVDGKITVPVIDSLLRYTPKEIAVVTDTEAPNVGDELKKYPFERYSTDLKSLMAINFGELNEMKKGLMRVDVIWNNETGKQKFQLLLYYNDKGILKGVEYEKP